MAAPILRAGLFLSLVLVSAAPRSAVAAVDMSGEWYVEFNLFGSFVPGQASVTQIGTSLTIVTTLSCATCFPDTSVGTIDPDTGVFSVTSTTYPVGTLTAEGVVATDSYTYTANLFNDGSPQGDVVGSRCANGTLEAPEQCDDGNRSDFDCCTSACQFKSAGGSCPSDGIQCTDSVCDGAGTCTHPLSAPGTSCTADDEHCTRDTCDGSGGCAVTGFLPAGVPCDSLNGEWFCTSDTCDGAGACTHAPQNEGEPCEVDESVCTIDECVSGVCTSIDAVECPTCEACDPEDGCVARPLGCTTERGRGASLLLKSDPAQGDVVQWQWPRGQTLPIADIAAGSAALGAVLCVIDTESSSTVAVAEYPPGADWGGTPLRATYRRSSAAGKASARIKQTLASPQELAVSAKASGSELGSLQMPPTSSELVVELRHGGGVCWSSKFNESDLVRQGSALRRYKK